MEGTNMSLIKIPSKMEKIEEKREITAKVKDKEKQKEEGSKPLTKHILSPRSSPVQVSNVIQPYKSFVQGPGCS